MPSSGPRRPRCRVRARIRRFASAAPGESSQSDASSAFASSARRSSPQSVGAGRALGSSARGPIAARPPLHPGWRRKLGAGADERGRGGPSLPGMETTSQTRPQAAAPDLGPRPPAERRSQSGACASPSARSSGARDRPRGPPRRDLRLPRPERGRQDDDGRDPRGLPGGRRAARSRCSARTRRGAPRAWRERVGIVLQESPGEVELTVRECMEFYAGLYRRPRAGRRDARPGRPRGSRGEARERRSPAASGGGSTSPWR